MITVAILIIIGSALIAVTGLTVLAYIHGIIDTFSHDRFLSIGLMIGLVFMIQVLIGITMEVKSAIINLQHP